MHNKFNHSLFIFYIDNNQTEHMKLVPAVVSDHPLLVGAAVVVSAAVGFFVIYYFSTGSGGDVHCGEREKESVDPYLDKSRVGGQQLPPQGAEGFVARVIIAISQQQEASKSNVTSPSAPSSSGWLKMKKKATPADGGGKNSSFNLNFSREVMQRFFAEAEQKQNTTSTSSAAASGAASASATSSGEGVMMIRDAGNFNILRETCIRLSSDFDRLEALRKTSFDEKNETHLQLLQRVWSLGVQNQILAPGDFQRRSELWENLGFQGLAPETDLRAGGILSLMMFADFLEQNGPLMAAMHNHNKAEHDAKGMNWLLVACASINVTVTLMMPRSAARQELPWSEQLLCAIYRGSVLVDGSEVAEATAAAAAARRHQQQLSAAGLDEKSLHRPVSPTDIETGRAKIICNCHESASSDINNYDNINNKNINGDHVVGPVFSLYQALCRAHQAAMRRLWSEFVRQKVSVMEFERFVHKDVYEPLFFNNNSGEAIVF